MVDRSAVPGPEADVRALRRYAAKAAKLLDDGRSGSGPGHGHGTGPKHGTSHEHGADPEHAARPGHAAGQEHGAGSGHAAGHARSERAFDHAGHRVVVRTHYEIEVDGRPLQAHLSVDLDGQVTCHAIPAYSYPSAVDIVKRLIDTFPDDFPSSRKRKRPSAGKQPAAGHGPHDHHDGPHDHHEASPAAGGAPATGRGTRRKPQP